MSENEKQEKHIPVIELSEREKSGGLYILGVVLLIFMIVFLASLTHVFLHP